MGTTDVKRKRPPTFQHYPAKRAKKLKQIWVEAKKVKKQWRLEKKKLDLGGRKPEEEEQEEKNTVAVGDMVGEIADSIREEKDLVAEPRRVPTKKREPSKQEQAPSNLRKLAREAYSPSSLHSYKSDPLHRTKATVGGAFEPGRGNTGQRRGQPNMRLRMNFMLEKIKRDLSS